MNDGHKGVVLAIVMCASPLCGAAVAQKCDGEVGAGAAAETRRLEGACGSSVRSENGASESQPNQNEVSVIASKDKSTVKLTWGWAAAGGRVIGTLSAPVNKKDDATELLTLDGPVDEIQAGLGWKRQWYDTGKIDDLDLVELANRRDSLCFKDDWGKVPAEKSCTDTELEAAMKKAGVSPGRQRQIMGDFFRVKHREKFVPLFRAIPIQYLHFEGSVGETDREHFDQERMKQEEDRETYTAGVTYGRVFLSSRFTVSMATKRGFQEQKNATQCTPIENSELERCEELPLGEATEVDSVPLTLEFRSWKGRWAISPKVAYDFEREIAAASLPLYFVRDKDGKLSGGLRADWEDGKGVSVSVFVSGALQ